jgi:hypothetical protein
MDDDGDRKPTAKRRQNSEKDEDCKPAAKRRQRQHPKRRTTKIKPYRSYSKIQCHLPLFILEHCYVQGECWG